MPPPRILHVINGEYFGGSARVLMNYLTASTRRADVKVIVHFEGELLDRLVEQGVSVELLPMRGRLDVSATRRLVRLAQRWNADLLHSHQLRNTLLARLGTFVGGPPVVTHVHSPAFRESTRRFNNVLTGAVDRALASRTRRFIVVSRSLRDELRRLRVPDHRIRVVPNGIPPPSAATAAAREALRREFDIGESLIVGLVANLRPRKGADILLRAASELRRAGMPLHLVFVGEGFREHGRDYGAELRALAVELDLADHITFTGFRADAEAIIAGLDAFVLPSLFGEGLPMSLLEAMGAGVPVISTPVEGIVEVVEDGRTGLLVPAGNVAALGQSLHRLLTDQGLAQAIRTHGREAVSRQFSADAMAQSIEAVYGELL